MRWNVLFPLEKKKKKVGKYTNFHPGVTIIAVSLFASLCCGLRPKLCLGRTPTTTKLLLPKTHEYMSTKTLFSRGLQNPSQDCSGLAKQGIPLQGHAPFQQDLFIHGQCLSKDAQNYFLALLEGFESSQRIACYTKIQSPFVSVHSLDVYSLSQLPLKFKVFRAEMILLPFPSIWHAESCDMLRAPVPIAAVESAVLPSPKLWIEPNKTNKKNWPKPTPKISTTALKWFFPCLFQLALTVQQNRFNIFDRSN